MNEIRKYPVYVVYSRDDHEYYGVYHDELKALERACTIYFDIHGKYNWEYVDEELNKNFKTAKEYFNSNNFQKCYERLIDLEDEGVPEIIETELIE